MTIYFWQHFVIFQNSEINFASELPSSTVTRFIFSLSLRLWASDSELFGWIGAKLLKRLQFNLMPAIQLSKLNGQLEALDLLP